MDKRDHPDWHAGTQRVVVYNDANGREQVYATAYTNDQQQDAIQDCEARYGRDAKPRAAYAKERPIGR